VPYTLLSGWASFVPGVQTTIMTIEQGGPPLFGENNLPDPWSSPILTRIQMAFNRWRSRTSPTGTPIGHAG
jgi:hypothetical protein